MIVLSAVGALSGAVWLSGLVYPIATHLWSVLAPRPLTAETEADPI